MLKGIGDLFRKKLRIGSKRVLGVDIGTSSIRVVEISRRGYAYKLENYGEIELSFIREQPFLVYKKDILILSNKRIAKALQAILKEAGIQTREANFSIPDYCSFSTSFKLPSMDKEEIPEAVNYEVRPYIPLPLSEITLDWSVIEGEISKTPLKVLVVAIPNDIIAQYQEIAQFAELNLRVLEPEVLSLSRALIKEKDKTIGIIDIGARSTTYNILAEGILKMSYSFNVGSNELTEAIVKSLNIDYNKAEGMKKEFGLSFNNQQNNNNQNNKKNIRYLLLPLIDLILGEAKKFFRDFYQNEGKEVEKVILAGGMVYMPGLKEYFSSELKKEIIIANPFLGLGHPPELIKNLELMGPSYTIAVGVALKGLE